MTGALEGLPDLLERIEAATGPDREIDCAIFTTLGFECEWTGREMVFIYSEDDSRPWGLVPSVTSSVDAALALVERSGEDVRTILYEALEHQGVYGWSGDKSLIDQLAREIVAALIRALLAKEPSNV